MTNWENFKEVFHVVDGVNPGEDICSVLCCPITMQCKDCLGEFEQDSTSWWQQEYKEA